MLRTFNMGLGLIVAVAAEDVDRTMGTLRGGDAALRGAGEQGARVIGEIAAASPGNAPAVRYEA